MLTPWLKTKELPQSEHSETGSYARFNWVMTNFDYHPLELSVGEYFEKPVLRNWRTSKGRIVEE